MFQHHNMDILETENSQAPQAASYGKILFNRHNNNILYLFVFVFKVWTWRCLPHIVPRICHKLLQLKFKKSISEVVRLKENNIFKW